MKPKIISLHYTAKCGRNCPHCYLKKQISSDKEEIIKDEWLKLPQVLSCEDYIEKIAIALNFYTIGSLAIEEETNFLISFLEQCLTTKIKVDITTDFLMVNYFTAKIHFYNRDLFSVIDVFSISIDNNRFSSFYSNKYFLELTVEKIKKHGINNVNANFLISKESAKWIKDNILEELSKIFDTVHIIFEKPFTYTKDEYYNIIEDLFNHNVFENDKYIIDPCILFRLGLVEHCHNTNYIIDINQYGNVSGCAYDHFDMSIDNIKKMDDVLEILKKTEDKKITRCNYLEFVDNL